MHFLIQEALMRLLLGKGKRRLLILTPPQHSKTTIVSQLFPALALALQPELKLLLLSYSASLSVPNGRRARDIVDHFLSDQVKLQADAKTKEFWITDKGGSLFAAGLKGSVTGRPANGILIDDPYKSDKEADSPWVRETVLKNYSAVVETRLSPTGWIAMICTRWNDDDLAGTLLALEADKWEVLRFSALGDDEEPYDPLERQIDLPLWPERYPLAWYQERRKSYEERGLIHQWYSMYMANPRGDGTTREFNTYLHPEPMYKERPQTALTVLACEPSKDQRNRSDDYSAFTLIHVEKGLKPNLYVESWAFRGLSIPAVVDQSLMLIEKKQPTAFVIKGGIYTGSFVELIASELRKKKMSCATYNFNEPQDYDKKARIRLQLGNRLKEKRIHFHERSPGSTLMLSQLKKFPQEREKDDLPRALCMGLSLITQIAPGLKI